MPWVRLVGHGGSLRSSDPPGPPAPEVPVPRHRLVDSQNWSDQVAINGLAVSASAR